MNKENNLLKRWLAGDLTEKEREHFEKTEDYLAYTDILRAAEKFDRPTFDVEKNLKYQKEYNKTYASPTSKIQTLKPWLYAAAAIIIILFGIKSLFFNSTKLHTDIAETITVALPDKSIVRLNADSWIEFDKSSFEKDRNINLKGEGFFDVKKGATFTVTTDNGSITVLGTEFNVSSRNEALRVHCFEGKVQVNNIQDTIVLMQGQAATSDKLTPFSLFKINHSTPSWLEGKSSFDQAPLSEVIEELKRQYDIEITILDIDTKRLFTGFFTNNNLESALKTCFEPMNISYIFKTPKSIELKNQ